MKVKMEFDLAVEEDRLAWKRVVGAEKNHLALVRIAKELGDVDRLLNKGDSGVTVTALLHAVRCCIPQEIIE